MVKHADASMWGAVRKTATRRGFADSLGEVACMIMGDRAMLHYMYVRLSLCYMYVVVHVGCQDALIELRVDAEKPLLTKTRVCLES